MPSEQLRQSPAPVCFSSTSSSMAAFHAEFTLCALLPGPGGAPGGLLGVEACGEEADRLLVTDPGRTVTVYKVSDQKPLGSWTVKQGQTITCPAVFNFLTGEYVLVHDDKVLRIWKDDDVNLEKVFKATLSLDVFRLHSLPYLEPLVLFKGGATRFLDALLAAPQQEIADLLSEEEVIRWSDIFVEGELHVLVFVAERHGDWFVYVQNLKVNSLLKYKVQQEKEASVPLSFTGSVRNKCIILLALYSSGQIYEIELPLHQPESVEEHLVSKSLLLMLPVSSNTAVTLLDKTHVAILGALPLQQNSVNECLSIWNTKFKTVQASKELPQGTSGQLWCYGNKLYVPHGKMLTVIPYQCDTSSLAAALGKLKAVQMPEIETMSSIKNWNTFLGDESLPPSSHQASIIRADQRKSLRTKKKIHSNSEPHDIAVEKLLSNIKNAYPGHIEEELTYFLSGEPTPDFQLTIGRVTTALVSRCKTQPNFYPGSAINRLVQTNRLSYSSCPDLFTVLLEKEDMHLIQLCLQQYPDVPEEVTCACLKAILSISDVSLEKMPVDLDSVVCYFDGSSDKKANKPAEILQNGFSPVLLEEDSCDIQLTPNPDPDEAALTCPVSMKKASLLNSVLLTKYSETFLLPHLKDLSSQQVIQGTGRSKLVIYSRGENGSYVELTGNKNLEKQIFLQYLQYLYLKCSENVGISLPGVNAPNLNQIIDWMSLLLDAHFTVVVMLPEAKGLLANLHKYVRSQVKLYSELNKIEGCLLELQKMKRQKNDLGLYSIEVLEFV